MADLWNNHSGLPGLLDAFSQERMQRSGILYNPEDNKYYSIPSGRPITNKQLRSAIMRVSNEASVRMKKETQQLIAGAIILSVWYMRMRNLMKALYKTVWLVSIGGFLFDDDLQRNAFYAFILLQFGYLDNFASQIESGEQALNGMAMTRAGMYGKHGNTEWLNIKLDKGKRMGRTEGRRILGPNENHCTDREHPESGRPGCLELAGLGWIPIGQIVPLGGAICYDNCLCDLELR